MTLDEIASLDIKGFLDEEEGRLLHDLALSAGMLGPCMEIGGYCGRSTVYLGHGCREAGSVLYSIDHHRGSEEQQKGQEYFDPDLWDEKEQTINTFRLFRRALARADLEDTVIPIVAPSSLVARMWSTPLGMVFIDGGHSYASAFSDYTSWMPHIVPGGYLAIHDIFTDPSQGGQAPYYIYKLALSSGLFAEMPVMKTLGVLQRLKTGVVPDHVRSIRDW